MWRKRRGTTSALLSVSRIICNETMVVGKSESCIRTVPIVVVLMVLWKIYVGFGNSRDFRIFIFRNYEFELKNYLDKLTLFCATLPRRSLERRFIPAGRSQFYGGALFVASQKIRTKNGSNFIHLVFPDFSRNWNN